MLDRSIPTREALIYSIPISEMKDTRSNILRAQLARHQRLIAEGPIRFGALEEVFMSYKPHGAWRTMEVLEELA
jgi:hypothetical protein